MERSVHGADTRTGDQLAITLVDMSHGHASSCEARVASVTAGSVTRFCNFFRSAHIARQLVHSLHAAPVLKNNDQHCVRRTNLSKGRTYCSNDTRTLRRAEVFGQTTVTGRQSQETGWFEAPPP